MNEFVNERINEHKNVHVIDDAVLVSLNWPIGGELCFQETFSKSGKSASWKPQTKHQSLRCTDKATASGTIQPLNRSERWN